MKMPDPFGSMQNMMNQFRSFLRDPMQLAMKRAPNMPRNIQGDPDAMIQYMVDNGLITQDMYNAASRISQQASQHPEFQQLMGENGKR